MNGRRQRLAWFLLLAGLVTCVGLVVAAPLGVNAYIQNATRPLLATLDANQGTVGVQAEGLTSALFAEGPPLELEPDSRVLTGAADTALLVVREPIGQRLLAQVQIYANSDFAFREADKPRFSSSREPDFLSLALQTGRVVLNVSTPEQEALNVDLQLPAGRLRISQAGRYAVSVVEGETQLSVLAGSAVVSGLGANMQLHADQRAVLTADGQLEGPLPAVHSLVVNSDFAAGFEQWLALASNIEIAGEPGVDITITDRAGERALIFGRIGVGHTDAGVRQIINRDVTDFESLRLAITLRVVQQSLGVCGNRGSECPLTVQIDYVDAAGLDQTWRQGFFANGQVGGDTPNVCITCPPPLSEHRRVQFGQTVFYESENLMESLTRLNARPQFIESLTLVAAGHSFVSEIQDVALLARE
ncbi:MAG: hypothetical protein ACRDHL_10250 [Candidatus Promineifilaceae bacterium]